MYKTDLLVPNIKHDAALEAELVKKEAAAKGNLDATDFTTFVTVAEFVPGTEAQGFRKKEILGTLDEAGMARLAEYRATIASKARRAAKNYAQYVVNPKIDAPGRIPEAEIITAYGLFFRDEDPTPDSKSVAEMQLALFKKLRKEGPVDAWEFLLAKRWQRWSREEQRLIHDNFNAKERKQYGHMFPLLHVS